MPLRFTTKSTLPIEAAVILGISAKEGENAIGRFGTGLKYAIAGIMRLGGNIIISTGGKSYTFGTYETEVRGKKFYPITCTEAPMEGGTTLHRLGFTTELGKHWKPWMYARELLSNTMDEGGEVHFVHAGEIVLIQEPYTHIQVNCEPLDQAMREKNKWHLTSSPLYATEHGEVHKNVGHSGIYYQGFLVGQADTPSDYTYNILSQTELTEDRTMQSWVAQNRLADIIWAVEDERFLKSFIENGEKKSLETELYTPPPSHVETNLPVLYQVLKKVWGSNPTSLPENLANLAIRLFKDNEPREETTLTSVERAKFQTALTFLSDINCKSPVDWRFFDAKDSAFAYYDRNMNAVYINRKCFEQGTQFLAQTMLEEYIHCTFDIPDYSREFQDKLLGMFVSLYEELKGKPL